MILLNNIVLLQFRFFVHFVSQFITAIMHIKPYMHFFFFFFVNAVLLKREIY